MAEIVDADSVDSGAGVGGEPRSRAARKRRMDLRKLRTAFNGIPKKTRRAADGEEVDEAEAERMCPGYGMTSMCGRRREMEDAVSIRPRFSPKLGYHFFAVFDGHGCSHVAVSCKNRMHELVAAELESAGESREWKGLMERSFFNMESELLNQSSTGGGGGVVVDRKMNCKCQPQSVNCDYVGSTAVVAVLTSEELIVANCGDSRALLCRGGVPTPLSVDHKPDRPDELERIHDAGGRVIYWDGARVLGVLAMSRAIGDNLLKPYVTSEPEVTVTGRAEEDEFLILASDGLWDVVPNKMACEVVRVCLRDNPKTTAATAAAANKNAKVEEVDEWNNKQGGSNKACRDAAFLLTKLAMARLSSDNVSVVVVDLRSGSCSSNSNSSSSSSSSSSGLLEL